MYKKISDYGIIGNLQTVALVGLDGSIDWMCLPFIDSPSVFGALLDDKKGGRFSIFPKNEWDSTAEYLEGTNILRTRFRTRGGVLQLTDFMPIAAEGNSQAKQELYRMLEVLEGEVAVRILFEPCFNYARSLPSLQLFENGIAATDGKETITLSFSGFQKKEDRASETAWTLRKGDKECLKLDYGPGEPERVVVGKAEELLRDTEIYWQNWLKRSETGRAIDLGPYKNMVDRSALVLKLLSYEPTGAIAAAASTSLPEEIGGERNWDYRYTWVRDTSFTLQALFNLGHMAEMEGYLRWLKKLLSEYGADRLQIMYGLRGEEELPEEELTHLDGYKGSRPVRIGNSAASQRQLDIYGELLDAALKLSDYVGKIDEGLWPFLRDICDYAVDHWSDRDSGIWEVRGGSYQFVYSRVMCWVALNRGMIIAKRYGFAADLEKWESTAAAIKKQVIEKGWNEKKQAFVQHYETDALDASNLLIPILGFLPYDDHRVHLTLEATIRELGHNGFLYRYKGDDALSGKEGVFLLCTFWLIDNLIALERIDEAEQLLHRIENTANHLGLFSEEYDMVWKEPLGNFPQAFTHIGYINSVIALCRARGAKRRELEEEPSRKGGFFTYKILLNSGEPLADIPSAEVGGRLRSSMNILRGAFFDTPKGRVAYEKMRASDAYEEYLELSYTLKNMDIGSLKSREEKIAFWVNLYNVIVIHGVIELGIRDSVKEVFNFFRRIEYQVGELLFSPEDVEHGILRNNKRPPGALMRMFKKSDPRIKLAVDPIEPRIHFALVCASSSCPPIDIYTAEKLDEELDIAARTFLNAGGIAINRKKHRVSLSRIFKWYAGDFAAANADRIRFIARFMNEPADREFLLEHAEELKTAYQDYDWRLNRN